MSESFGSRSPPSVGEKVGAQNVLGRKMPYNLIPIAPDGVVQLVGLPGSHKVAGSLLPVGAMSPSRVCRGTSLFQVTSVLLRFSTLHREVAREI